MRLSLVLVLVAAAGWVAAADEKDDAVKKDLEKFQGTWLLAEAEVDGAKVPAEQTKQLKRIIKGDKVTLKRGDDELAHGAFTIDPSKKPKTIDFVLSNADNAEQKFLGIYEVDGTTCKTCIVGPGLPRPTEFTSKEGSGHRLATWKKEK